MPGACRHAGRALQTGSRRVEGANGTDGENGDSGKVVAAAVTVLGRVDRDEVGEHQARVIEYQRAENTALLERLGKHRLRLTDGERRRLATLGKEPGRTALQQVATIATRTPSWGSPSGRRSRR